MDSYAIDKKRQHIGIYAKKTVIVKKIIGPLAKAEN